MVLLAGAGLERGMTEEAEDGLKDEWGAFGYILGGLKHIKKEDIFEATLKIDNQTHSFQTGSVTIANTAPKTSIFAQGGTEPLPDDGLLDVTVIVNVESEANAAETLVQLLKNKPTEGNEFVRHFQGKHVELKTNPVQKLVIDGEITGATPITIDIVPAALNVCSSSN